MSGLTLQAGKLHGCRAGNMKGPVEACSSLGPLLHQTECPGAQHAACFCPLLMRAGMCPGARHRV